MRILCILRMGISFSFSRFTTTPLWACHLDPGAGPLGAYPLLSGLCPPLASGVCPPLVLWFVQLHCKLHGLCFLGYHLWHTDRLPSAYHPPLEGPLRWFWWVQFPLGAELCYQWLLQTGGVRYTIVTHSGH